MVLERRILKVRSLYDNQSLKIEPDFSLGIAFKGRIWMRSIYTLGLNDKIIADSVDYYATKAIEADPSEPAGYLLRADLKGFLKQFILSQARLCAGLRTVPE